MIKKCVISFLSTWFIKTRGNGRYKKYVKNIIINFPHSNPRSYTLQSRLSFKMHSFLIKDAEKPKVLSRRSIVWDTCNWQTWLNNRLSLVPEHRIYLTYCQLHVASYWPRKHTKRLFLVLFRKFIFYAGHFTFWKNSNI